MVDEAVEGFVNVSKRNLCWRIRRIWCGGGRVDDDWDLERRRGRICHLCLGFEDLRIGKIDGIGGILWKLVYVDNGTDLG